MSHPDLENRLRAAYAAHAEAIPTSQAAGSGAELIPLQPAIAPRRHRPGRTTSLLLAAACVIGIGAGAVALTRGDATHHDKPASTRSAPDLHPEVPWDTIGPGWDVATWAQTQPGAQSLYLIAPSGRHYLVGHLAATDSIAQWSNDGRQVWVAPNSGRQYLLDLRTGVRTSVPDRNVGQLTLDGTATLTNSNPDGTPAPLRRYSLNGRLEATYPASVPGIGKLDNSYWLEQPGTGRVILPGQHGLAVLNTDGTLARALPVAAGQCDRLAWWSKDAVQVQCGSASALWKVPLDGGAPTVIASKRSGPVMFGYDYAWQTSVGTYALAGTGCGPELIVKLAADGTPTPAAIPMPAGVPQATSISYVDHHGDVLLVAADARGQCESSRTTLVAYNVATGTSTALLGGTVNGGTVIRVIGYDSRP